MADRFTYEEDELILKDSQCEFCRHYRMDDVMHCERYPEGKPQEIADTMRICPFLFSDNTEEWDDSEDPDDSED